MKQFWIIFVAGALIIAGAITLTNYIEHRNKYRETTPNERQEFEREQAAKDSIIEFVKKHPSIRFKIDSVK